MVEIIVLFNIGLPLLLTALFLIRFQAKISAFTFASFLLAHQLLMLVIGNTTWFGPLLPRAFLLLACLGFILTWKRHRGVPWFNGFRWPTRVVTFLSLGLLASYGSSALDYLKTRRIDREPVDLVFPLRHGTYTIVHGGSEEITNQHVTVPGQKYALDIVKTGAGGRRAQGILPSNLNSYRIYGETIAAPCAGKILAFGDILVDQSPPETSPFSIAGNYVILFCKNTSILFAHLQYRSVLVKTGDLVQESQPLARVGNTGNTSEPHLHVQANQGYEADVSRLINDATPVPMRWHRRFLIGNDWVKVD